MPCDNKALLKALQVAVCFAGLIYKIWTSWESERVFLTLQKESRDWRWTGFANPTSLSSIFIDLAFGAFAIITFGLLIGHVLGDPRTIAERLFMIIGFLMMVVVGGILITSVDDVPYRLYDNAIILGVLAFVAGVLFLIDAGTKCATKKKKSQPVIGRSKREIEIVPKVEEKKEDTVVVEQREVVPKEEKKEEAPPPQQQQPTNGIKSVEIRIKDPTKNWPVYGQRSKTLTEIETLAEAERVDRMLQRAPDVEQEPVLLHSRRGGTASVQPSPVKHTSSFYIGGPFSWRRMNDQEKK